MSIGGNVHSKKVNPQLRSIPSNPAESFFYKIAEPYLSLGFRIIPIKPGEKSPPLIKNWHEGASNESEKVLTWATKWPNANIGVLMGAGYIGLDLDTKDPSANGIDAIKAASIHLPPTVAISTPTGGQHHIFHLPADYPPVKNAVRTLPGVDIRSDAGYLVGVGSRVTAGLYKWLKSKPQSLEDVAPTPPALLRLLKQSGDAPQELYTPGQRNDLLFRYGCSLRSMGSSPEEILKILHIRNREACKPPLPDAEIQKIADSCTRFEKGTDNYFLTEMGNSDRLFDQVGGNLFIIQGSDLPLWWNETHYTRESCRPKLHESMRSLLTRLSTHQNDEVKKFGKRCQTKSHIENVIHLLFMRPEIQITTQQLDPDPLLINVKNGVLDLRTKEIVPHDRRFRMTSLLPVLYDPSAESPNFIRFLDQILPDPEVRSFLKLAIGYSLTTSTEAQCFFILHGSGANGKSTFLNVIHQILGQYAHVVDASTFFAIRKSNIRTDLVSLMGKRFIQVNEFPAASRRTSIDTDLIKSISAGDHVVCRDLFQRGGEISYPSTGKLFFITNNKPDLQGDTSEGLWRRVRFIPFPVRIPREEQDPKLAEKLLAEAPGIFNWMVQGCIEWQQNGLKAPQAVEAATTEYREELDQIGRFMAETLEITHDPTDRIQTKELYERYCYWCEDNKEMSRRVEVISFGTSLSQRGIDGVHTKHGKARIGLRWLTEARKDI